MRVLAVVVLLAGCDKLFSLAEVPVPDGRTGKDIDGSVESACTASRVASLAAADAPFLSDGEDYNYVVLLSDESFYTLGESDVYSAPNRIGDQAEEIAVFEGETNRSVAVSPDGLTLWVTRRTVVPTVESMVWRATRDGLGGRWNEPIKQVISGPDDTSYNLKATSAAVKVGDEQRMVFASETGRLYELASGEGEEGWTVLQTIEWPPGASGYDDTDPTLSSDGNLLVFSSTRRDGGNAWDLYMSVRGANGDFENPTRLDNLSQDGDVEEYSPSLRGCELSFIELDGSSPGPERRLKLATPPL